MNMLTGLGNQSGMYKTKEIFNNWQPRENDEIPRRTSNNFRTTMRIGVSANKTSGKYIKDPDVWDPPVHDRRPPPPQAKRISKPLQNQSCNQRNGKPPVRDRRAGTNPLQKKTFLQERYADGNGPDANLIEMLEREVMDKSPNVKFEDIADL
jgi:katanin p60 ATPase-containing subunit A1